MSWDRVVIDVMTVTSMCQRDLAKGCPGGLLNITLGVYVRVSLEGTCNRICGLSEADGPLQWELASSNPLKS